MFYLYLNLNLAYMQDYQIREFTQTHESFIDSTQLVDS